jgi:hypothetical protein
MTAPDQFGSAAKAPRVAGEHLLNFGGGHDG